ncbi:MAG: hypothetical protein RSB93_00250 [Rikenellaceae bacterium]
MKKFVLTVIIIATVGVSAVKAQNYQKSVGVTIGPALGINASAFLSTKSSIEAQFLYNVPSRAPMFTALYRYHMSLEENLGCYFGGGLNVGATGAAKDYDTKFAFGVDPVVGVEYTFDQYPVAVAVDYAPAINIWGKCVWNQLSLKVKYIF